MQPETKGFFNVSYFEKEVNDEMIRMVGRPFSALKIFKMWGTGSPRMLIEEASEVFQPWMQADKYMQYCNIEIRPGGIIIRFRSRLEALAFVVSFSELEILENNNEYRISNGVNHMTLIPFKNKGQVRGFFRKLEKYRL